MSEETANIQPVDQPDQTTLRVKYKYKPKVTEKIYKLLSEKKYSIRELCKIVGISESIFYLWRNEIQEFGELLEKAENVRFDSILTMCEAKLEDLANGYEYEEVKSKFETEIIKDGTAEGKKVTKLVEQTVITKHVKPDLGAIIHLQTNLAPDKWKNRQYIDSHNVNKNLNANFSINVVTSPIPLHTSEEEVDIPQHIKDAEEVDFEEIDK